MLILSTYSILAQNSDDSNSDIPKSCVKWYDGCNDCSVVNGKIESCTERACLVQNPTKCLAYSDIKQPSSDCKLYYDGCNTCLYDENNEPGKCTDRACIKYETPKCIDDSDQYIAPTKETGPIKIPSKEPTSEKESFCSGCESEDKCYPLGYRKSGNFCSDNYEFISQSQSDSQCENNFECSSNLCISNKCVSPSLIDKILNWFKGIFG